MSFEVKNLSFSYPGRDIFKDVSFQIEPGECMSILGVNGVGKSTLLKCINHIIKPKSGNVLINGNDAMAMSRIELARNIGYVSQSCEFAEGSVFDSVLLGRKPFIKWDVTAEDLKIVQDVMQMLSLEEYARRNVNQLSGGEKQKISIARALAQSTQILLFDEPTSNLDIKNQLEVLDIIKKIVKEKNLCAAVTIHDLNLALRFADKFLMMKDGEVFAFGDSSVITPENIYQVYGVPSYVVEYENGKIFIPK